MIKDVKNLVLIKLFPVTMSLNGRPIQDIKTAIINIVYVLKWNCIFPNVHILYISSTKNWRITKKGKTIIAINI